MLNGYKVVAFCTTKINTSVDNEIIMCINEKLRYKGYRLFVYSTNSDLFWGNRSEQGEKYVFDLLDFDSLDCVIISYEKIKDRALSETIANRAKEKGIPVIVLDGNIDGCFNLKFDYKDGFEKIVRHVVEGHGIRRLHMMAGMRNNEFSDERIEVFRKVLADNNIPVDDSMISYGDFWSVPTRAATEELIARGELPEAVVCANDSMAVTMCAVFKEHGVVVPDDIIVIGFDGINDGQIVTPTISTCMCANEVRADMIADIIMGKFSGGSECISLSPRLELAQSCGCIKENPLNFSEHLTRVNDYFNRYIGEEMQFFELASSIFGCRSFEEVAKQLEHPMVYNFTCVLRKECIDETVNPMTIPEQCDEENLYLLLDTDFPGDFTPHEFKSTEVYPRMKVDMESGYPLIFMGLNALEIPLGYVCFHFHDYDIGNYYKVHQTASSVGNAICGFRNIRHQNYLNARMEEIYKLDRLTGLYNRNALVSAYEKNESEWRRGSEKISFVLVDLDRLKYINDTFGHNEGDYAIRAAADALVSAAPSNAVLARWGGDELVALFTGECVEADIRERMAKYLEEISQHTEKPYAISASVGAVSVNPAELISLDELTKSADRFMYKDKLARRMARK